METDKYVRVTEILRPFSGIDFVPVDIVRAAAERGSRVHALCQGVIEDIDVEVPDELKGYVESFRQWHEGKTYLEHPGRAYCDKLMLTGECDGVLVNGTIFDLKTSQKEGKTWSKQGAAYGYLMNLHRDQVFVILDKGGGAPKECLYHYEENIDVFMKCVELYRIFFNKRNPINIEDL